ncbi:MAG: hypothetical protein ABIZ18_01185 [Caldimonas sp.]
MSLTALPAFANRPRWIFDNDARAIIVGPGASMSVVDALRARCRPLAAILVTRRAAETGPVETVRRSALRTWKTEFR